MATASRKKTPPTEKLTVSLKKTAMPKKPVRPETRMRDAFPDVGFQASSETDELHQQRWVDGLSREDFLQQMLAFWTRGVGFAGQVQQQAKAAIPAALAPLEFDQNKLLAAQKRYLQEWEKLIKEGVQPHRLEDRRFSSQAWFGNAFSSFAAAAYLVNARALTSMAEAVKGNVKTRARVAFATQQWLDAASPANMLAFNPEALKQALESEGKSLAQGIQNMLSDLRAGRIAQTDVTAFEVGKNVATTEGAVVYENPLFQLIEYKPLTDKVYELPFLFIPPCINKYYILDLRPENSLIRYTVAQGHRTFVLSWRNPDESLRDVTWDDYVEKAAIEAIHRVQDISGAAQINALGFCVGGTILSNALALMASRKDHAVASATFLTTLMDFTHTGVLDVFIDEGMVRYREAQFAKGGVLSGKELALTFNFLRPNDLVWNYVQGTYLLGKTPPAFDLLYWNGDSTNLPGPMYAWYLRNMYLENRITTPGACKVGGVGLDLRTITVPAYIYGSREDHIVPIEGAYMATQRLGSRDMRFVVGASGHIAGVINPPQANKRCYWTQDESVEKASSSMPESYAEWFVTAQEHAGSWWSDWSVWLAGKAGRQKAAPKHYGNAQYKVVESAPGRYVKE